MALKSIEHLKAIHASELAELEMAHSMAAQMPYATVRHVIHVNKDRPHIVLEKAPDMQTALAMLGLAHEHGHMAEYALIRNAVLEHRPFEGDEPEKAEFVCYDGAPSLRLVVRAGNCLVGTEIDFYWFMKLADGRFASVVMDVLQHNLRGFTDGDRYSYRQLAPNLSEDKRISWATGGSDFRSFSRQYYWENFTSFQMSESSLLAGDKGNVNA